MKEDQLLKPANPSLQQPQAIFATSPSGDALEILISLEIDWLPPRDSNPDNLLQRQVS